jgi:uncharacterized protein (DUF4415 family)
VNKQPLKPVIEDDDDVDLSNLHEDDAPELTPEMMANAKRLEDFPEHAAFAEFIRKGGRPTMPSDRRKQRITIMLDPDVLAHFKEGGKGWQTRINAALRRVAGLPD